MNSFGRIFKVTIFGESHGNKVGVVIDGCPAGIEITEEMLLKDLRRRRAGGKGTTPRIEPDVPHISSGVFNNKSTGAPIMVYFENTNIKSGDYSNLVKHPRPGHSDFVAQKKYGNYNDPRGGGHFSGRITLGLVTAGAIAKQIVAPIKIHAAIKEVGGSTKIREMVDKTVEAHDSIGGLIECICTNMPVGLGEPFFDSAESLIAHLVFAVPATKGVEFGSGFEAAKMKGSEHNDNILNAEGKTETNNAGGIVGGITNGNDLVFRVAIKPTSSIGIPQQTMNLEHGKVEELIIEGRHDACIAIRIPVIIESIAAIALADMTLIEQQKPRVF